MSQQDTFSYPPTYHTAPELSIDNPANHTCHLPPPPPPPTHYTSLQTGEKLYAVTVSELV